jgi:hypothetical protein
LAASRQLERTFIYHQSWIVCPSVKQCVPMMMLIRFFLKAIQPWLSDWLKTLAEKVPDRKIQKYRKLLEILKKILENLDFTKLYTDNYSLFVTIMLVLFQQLVILFLRSLLERAN